MSVNLSAIFYLISGVLFILALRGLSSPETSRRGNLFGINWNGNCYYSNFFMYWKFFIRFYLCFNFLLNRRLSKAFIAYKIPMTAMPELLLVFSSLVGLAAVFVAISAFLNPDVFNLGF